MANFGKIASQLSAGVKREFLSPSKVRLSLAWGFPYEAFDGQASLKFHTMNCSQCQGSADAIMDDGYGRIASQTVGRLSKWTVISPARICLTISGGFPHEAFDGQGHIRPWHIINLLESTRILSFWRYPGRTPDRSCYLHIDKILDSYLHFQVCASLSILPAAYDASVPKQPLVIDKELVYVGKTSFTIKSRIFVQREEPSIETELLHCQGEELASNYSQAVSVNKSTRRPEPLPDWWRDKFQSYSNPSQQLIVSQEEEPSDRPVYSYRLRINYSDLDPYVHANWSCYFRYCLDGIVGSAHVGGRAPLIGRQVERMDVLFVNEGNLAEWLDIRFWNTVNSEDKFHCRIIASDSGKLLSYAIVTLYPPSHAACK